MQDFEDNEVDKNNKQQNVQEENKKKRKNKNKNKKKNKQQGGDINQNQEENYMDKINKMLDIENIMKLQPQFEQFDENAALVENKLKYIDDLVVDIQSKEFKMLQVESQDLLNNNQQQQEQQPINPKKKQLISQVDKQIQLLESKLSMINDFTQNEELLDIQEILDIAHTNLQQDILKNQQFKQVIIEAQI